VERDYCNLNFFLDNRSLTTQSPVGEEKSDSSTKEVPYDGKLIAMACNVSHYNNKFQLGSRADIIILDETQLII